MNRILKKIMYFVCILAFAVLATYNFTLSKHSSSKWSGLLLANIEALADETESGVVKKKKKVTRDCLKKSPGFGTHLLWDCTCTSQSMTSTTKTDSTCDSYIYE